MKHYLHQKDFIYILPALKIHATLFTPERPPIHHKIQETKREREQTDGCGGESRQKETRERGRGIDGRRREEGERTIGEGNRGDSIFFKFYFVFSLLPPYPSGRFEWPETGPWRELIST